MSKEEDLMPENMKMHEREINEKADKIKAELNANKKDPSSPTPIEDHVEQDPRHAKKEVPGDTPMQDHVEQDPQPEKDYPDNMKTNPE